MSNLIYGPETIENNFKYHKPKDGQQERYEDFRKAGKVLAKTILGFCPNSPEKTIAFRKLEECIMWANASIARNE